MGNTEEVVKKVIHEKLEIEEDIQMERAHRIGKPRPANATVLPWSVKGQTPTHRSQANFQVISRLGNPYKLCRPSLLVLLNV